MITIPGQIASAKGLRVGDRMLVHRLVKAWNDHRTRNLLRHRYYTMRNELKDLGISVPPQLRNLSAACGWGKKCVDVMVEHSKFEGYTADDAEAQSVLERIGRQNRLPVLYRKATTSALEQCFSLYFVSRGKDERVRVSAYPASACGVTWDDANDRIEAALFVVSMSDRGYGTMKEPDWVNVVTDEYLIRIKYRDGVWHAEYMPHGLGHLPVFMAAHEPTLDRPFGTSRITREVMGYIDSAVRANVNEEIAAAFAVSTQKYLLGTADDPFTDITKWDAYVGSVFNIDYNADDEVMPQFGQLAQPSMEPLNVHWRILCGKMSAATGIHVSQFGQVHDNPASSDAIYAENEPLILKVKDWNEDAKMVLVDVATAALATERHTTFDAIDQEGLGIVANMPNPAMPTLAQQTDASVKIASVVPGFSQTRAFWTMNGFTVEETDRILRQLEDVRTREASNALIASIFGNEPEGVTSDGGAT